MTAPHSHAIVLSGGGARGAYQAGVLRAIYEIGAETGNFLLFRNLIGVSAGAINAAYLASEADDLNRATIRMCDMWKSLSSSQVFKTDYITVGSTAVRLLRGVSLGGISSRLRTDRLGLLNVEPLRDLLARTIDFEKIPHQVQKGHLHSLCITATDYSTALGVTFFTGHSQIRPWKRVQRIGVRANIGIDHVMASASIPIFFPPWPIEERHFGDGCLRNTAPLSPARHIGADRVLVVGVRKWKDLNLEPDNIVKPSLGRVLSVIINAVFMDAIEVDIERVNIINEALRAQPGGSFRSIDMRYIHPSIPPSDLAESRIEGLPPVFKFLMNGLGSPKESAEILSYLTFDSEYLTSLVDLGYQDTLKEKENLIQFLKSDV